MPEHYPILATTSALAVFLLLSPVANAQNEVHRVAVVDSVLVFNSYRRVKDIADGLKREFDVDALLQAARRPVPSLGEPVTAGIQSGSPGGRHTVGGAPPAGPSGHELRRDTDREEREFVEAQQYQLEEFNRRRKAIAKLDELEHRRVRHMRLVLRDILDATAEVAREGGYQVVLQAPLVISGLQPLGAAEEQEPPKVRKTAELLVQFFRESPVLYFGHTADLTEKVIGRLNAKYAAAQGPAPLPKPPAP